jgi:hypothetical protein
MLLFVNVPPHPPVAEAVASHAVKAASTWACVEQVGTVRLVGQVSTTWAGAVTVKVAVQVVVSGAQVLV